MTTFQHDSWQHDMRPTACTRWSEPRGKFCNNGDTCIQTYLMAMLGLWRLGGWEAGGHCMCCVVRVCACTVWGVEGWTGAAQYSCYLTQALARPLSCTQVSWPHCSHHFPEKSDAVLYCTLYSVLLCTRHCHHYQWSNPTYDDHPLILHRCPCYQATLSVVAIGGETEQGSILIN